MFLCVGRWRQVSIGSSSVLQMADWCLWKCSLSFELMLVLESCVLFRKLDWMMRTASQSGMFSGVSRGLGVNVHSVDGLMYCTEPLYCGYVFGVYPSCPLGALKSSVLTGAVARVTAEHRYLCVMYVWSGATCTRWPALRFLVCSVRSRGAAGHRSGWQSISSIKAHRPDRFQTAGSEQRVHKGRTSGRLMQHMAFISLRNLQPLLQTLRCCRALRITLFWGFYVTDGVRRVQN